MKKYDLVKLINEVPYKSHNLIKDMHGIVFENFSDQLSVLFFNPQNLGDYAVVNIKASDVIKEKEKLPNELLKELEATYNQIREKAGNILNPIKIKCYDMVELLIEDSKYSKYGIHKGNTGCVMDNNAVQGYIEVDFSGIDKNGKYYGDCISVKISDLKVINN